MIDSIKVDDSGILGGNPYDDSLWRIEPRGDHFVVLDVLGNVIATKPTREAAEGWIVDVRTGKLAELEDPS